MGYAAGRRRVVALDGSHNVSLPNSLSFIKPCGGGGAGGLVVVIVVVVAAQPPGQIQHHVGRQQWWQRARAMSQAVALTGGGGDGNRRMRISLRLGVLARSTISRTTKRACTLFHAPPFSSATFFTRHFFHTPTLPATYVTP